MANLVSFLVLLFSFSAYAIVPAGVPSATLGGYGAQVASMVPTAGSTTVALAGSDAFGVYAGTLSNAGTGRFYQLFRDGSNSTTANNIPNGSSWRCTNWTYVVGSASGGWQFVSSTTGFLDGASSITAGTYQFGAASVYGMSGNSTANAVTTEGTPYNFTGTGAAGTFAGVQFADSTQKYQVRGVCRLTTP